LFNYFDQLTNNRLTLLSSNFSTAANLQFYTDNYLFNLDTSTISIFTTLYVSPHLTAVVICIDSQCMINNFNKFDFLEKFSPTRNPLIVSFKKIKAYTQDAFNNKMDAFAKLDDPSYSLDFDSL
ncbi:5939_t:CDS:2, partial [Funneliformis geosporum]